jgi:hypothetical protein
MENLPFEVMFILGILSSVIVFILKKVFVEKGQEVPVWVYNIALGGIALALALVFAPVVIPPLPAHDGSLIGILLAVLSFLGALIPALVGVVGFARIVYEVLLQRILEGLGKALRSLVAPKGSDIG